MSAIFEAVNLLNRRLVLADTIGQSLDEAGGENAPPWVHVFRDQVESIREASEALETLLSGYGGTPPWKRSETEPALSRSHTTANPAGLAPDVGHAARTPPGESTRHERPEPASGGSAGTQDPSHLCTNERISQ
ncbi:hypothetical protein [Polaromonas sp. UBA4122]|uniref:hypothetical protein n=1 Tax=Polaromonas sp. UBA4122 TaxID=1947074 RepID=UPI0025FE7903|nr:hypothetical protein [Polaromonas sp. UBA4122]